LEGIKVEGLKEKKHKENKYIEKKIEKEREKIIKLIKRLYIYINPFFFLLIQVS